MKKIINSPDAFVDEVIEGILLAHPDQLRSASADNRAVVRRRAGRDDRVGIVTGGGSGHLPLFLGYVGEGLASGVAVGNVFSSPSPDQIYAATRASDCGKGVLYLYGNYGGDIYNFDLASDLAAADGIRTTTVLGADDVLSAPPEKAATRRGVAGLFFAYKTAGAAAAEGLDLDEVTRIAQKTADAVLTMGVGLSPTILPAAGEATFSLDEGEMEIGVGIHGEKGRYRGPLESADSITDQFMAELIPGLGLERASRVAVLVNGLGATPLEELYLIYRRTAQVLGEHGVEITRNYIGEYATSLEMAGASVSLLRLDDELLALLDAPAASPFYAHGTVDAASETGESVGAEVVTGAAEERAIRTASGPSAVRAIALDVVGVLDRHAEELRVLDAELGDGDLGITISSGAAAVARRLEGLPENAAPSEVLRAIGTGFAEGNPSTYAALVGGGIVSASTVVTDDAELGSGQWAGVVEAMVNAIQKRGKAERGDKTVVDVLWAIVDYLRATPEADADGVVAAARQTVDESAGWTSVRGRAGWAGERSIGARDPGSVALLRVCEEIAGALADA